MERKLSRLIFDCIEKFCDSTCSAEEKRQIIYSLAKKADIDPDTELDRRQFNELLLLCNKTRVTEEFFNYFTEGTGKLPIKYLARQVERFRKHSMLQFGNFRFALNKLIRSRNIDHDLGRWNKDSKQIISEFNKRLKPIMAIQKIERDKVHYLGYLTAGEDAGAKEKGTYNTEVYLTSDYMDVYVATSMRTQYDFQNVFDLCDRVFSSPKIGRLKLRYFDPTQSFSSNRIVKGLIEGLMLKRAKCTIYAAQESDSFGKDSELASTLAQGKPVIAFIPQFYPEDETYLDSLSNLPLNSLLDKATKCEKYVPSGMWNAFDSFLAKIIDYLETADRQLRKRHRIKTDEDQYKRSLSIRGMRFKEFVRIVAVAEAEFYNKRAKTLQELHPLAFQMNLESGVANGVLIARTYQQCADILYDVLTNKLDFEIIEPGQRKKGYLRDNENVLLYEKKSRCAFRVVTKNKLLTNSFWNFYLEER